MEQNQNNLVYTAMSKHLFYFRSQISQFVIERGKVPLNPFMIFDYFLSDTVERDKIRAANNIIVSRADEIWVFGPISNGVFAEIKLAQEINKPLKYFKLVKSRDIIEVSKDDLEFEDEIKELKGLI